MIKLMVKIILKYLEVIWELLQRLLFAKVVTFKRINKQILFQQTKLLGEGAYSMVYKGTTRFNVNFNIDNSNHSIADSHSDRNRSGGGNRSTDSNCYAVKKILVQSNENEKMTIEEINSLRKFSHENIIKMIDYAECYENNIKTVYILFPFIKSGSLRDLLNSILQGQQPKLSLPLVLSNYRKICSAFNVLHSYNPSYIHQDIKPEVSIRKITVYYPQRCTLLLMLVNLN